MKCKTCGTPMVPEYSTGNELDCPANYMCIGCNKTVVNPDLIYVRMPGGRDVRIFASDYETVGSLKTRIADRLKLRPWNWGIFIRSENKNRLVRIQDEDKLLKEVNKYKLRFFPNAVMS